MALLFLPILELPWMRTYIQGTYPWLNLVLQINGTPITLNFQNLDFMFCKIIIGIMVMPQLRQKGIFSGTPCSVSYVDGAYRLNRTFLTTILYPYWQYILLIWNSLSWKFSKECSWKTAPRHHLLPCHHCCLLALHWQKYIW